MIHTGDCIEVMRTLPADSVDAVVTDPPYGLEFMGKGWDKFGGVVESATDSPGWRAGHGGLGAASKNNGVPFGGGGQRVRYAAGHPFQAWCEAWGREALRVTKPGGYLLAFGGTRTHHRLVCGLEDAGWIIRDELTWVYASGFPKGKANLKPAHEPIVLARKPGPLRPLGIEECRIGTDGETFSIPQSNPANRSGIVGQAFQATGDAAKNQQAQRESIERTQALGRWPSNVLLDPDSAALFDEPNPEVVGSGATDVGGGFGANTGRLGTHGIYGTAAGLDGGQIGYGDSGGYSRFFLVPKSSRSDREPVVRGQSVDYDHSGPRGHTLNGDGTPRPPSQPRENLHPTVKPVDLMRHLIRLVTPSGGTVLDPFLGSGSTAIAAELEGFPWIGIEKEPEYVAIAEARLNGTQRGLGLSA